MRRRLLQCLEECVEGLCGQHVNLVDDEHLVLTNLRRHTHLLGEGTDIIHRVVRGSVQLMDVQRALFIESLARLTFVACLAVLTGVETVDGFGKDACAGGLAYAARPTEEISVCELAATDSILQRCGDGVLTNHRVEGHRAIFAG